MFGLAVSLRFCLGFVLLTLPIFALGQGSLKELQKESESLQQKVQLTQKLIQQTQSAQQQSLNELNLLNKQILLREQLLKNLELEVNEMQAAILRLETLIMSMQKDVITLRQEYAKTARIVYVKQNTVPILLWILSSESFTQAYDRMLYFRKFSQYRKKQIELIIRSQEFLQEKIGEHKSTITQKEEVLDLSINEKLKLSQSKQQKNQLINQMKTKEKQHKNELVKYQQQLNEIQKKIKDFVAQGGSKVSVDIIKELDTEFEKNQGKLPWPMPMPNGIVTGTFGVNIDEATGGQISNDGIFISTTKGQEVRAVFGGKVTMVGNIGATGKVVIVQHGNYRSVYANLDKVYVKANDNLSALQAVGTVKTNTQTGETKLHFLIYKGFTPVNPLNWIIKK